MTTTRLLDGLSNLHSETKVESYSHLDKDQLVTLLKDEEKLNQLTNSQFLSLVTTTEETAQFALKSAFICKKLNEIPLQEGAQTFVSSCAAKCILNILYDYKKIDKLQCTRVKELEIYTQIWLRPGDIADPEKIYTYLKKFDLNVSIVEIKNRTRRFLFKASEEIQLAYKFIQGNPHLPKKAIEDEKSIITSGNSFMLLCVCSHGTHIHVLHGNMQTDKFIVSFPEESQATTKSFQSLAEFSNNYSSNFTGMMFMISEQRKLELENHEVIGFPAYHYPLLS